MRKVYIFLLALGVRLLFLHQWSQTPYASELLSDAKYFDEWAVRIAGGEWLQGRVFYQSPVYAYFLAAVYKIFGHQLIAVQLIQVLVGSVSAVLFCALGTLVFGPAAGLVSGILAALYKPFIFYDIMILKSTWDILFSFFFLICAIRTHQNQKKSDAFLAGLFFGVSVLLRGNMILLTPLIPVWWYFSMEKRNSNIFHRTAVLGLLYVAGVFLPILPVAASNYFMGKDKVLLTYTGGVTLWLGNNPEADGLLNYPADFAPSSMFDDEEEYFVRKAEEASGRILKPSEISQFWKQKAVGYITSQPLAWLKLMGMKFLFFWNRYEFADNYDMDFIRREFRTVLNFPLFTFGFIAPFSIIGAILAWKKGRVPQLLIALSAAYMGSVILFIVTDRFRLPDLVYLIPLAAYALVTMFEDFKQKRAHSVRLYSMALPIAFVLCWAPIYKPNFHVSHGTLAYIYQKQGQEEKAVQYYLKAVTLNPEAADALLNLSLIYAKSGENDKALFYGEKAVAANPNYLKAHHNLGNLHYMRKDYAKAIWFYQKTVEIDPGYANGYNNIGSCFMAVRQYGKAAAFYRKALEVSPENPSARSNLDALKKAVPGLK